MTQAAAALLSAQALTLDYGARRVLNDVNFDVSAGEIVAVVGPSGAGKSSLLSLLAGLQTPTAGQVLVSGKRAEQAHANVAVAFQDARLLPWRSVRQNVAFGLDFASQPKLTRAEQAARVDAALERVSLTHAAQLLPSQLSGGMAQRVALARCIARRPSVLLLDEPFGALDEVTRDEMQQLLLQVGAELQAATVLVTHDIDEALLVAQRVLLLGGNPARVQRAWSVELPQPRAQTLEELGRTRLEILRQLRSAFSSPSHSLST